MRNSLGLPESTLALGDALANAGMIFEGLTHPQGKSYVSEAAKNNDPVYSVGVRLDGLDEKRGKGKLGAAYYSVYGGANRFERNHTWFRQARIMPKIENAHNLIRAYIIPDNPIWLELFFENEIDANNFLKQHENADDNDKIRQARKEAENPQDTQMWNKIAQAYKSNIRESSKEMDKMKETIIGVAKELDGEDYGTGKLKFISYDDDSEYAIIQWYDSPDVTEESYLSMTGRRMNLSAPSYFSGGLDISVPVRGSYGDIATNFMQKISKYIESLE